jgi:aryl-alcohol dehydrogenase-like predicted oxidoreductase
VIGNWMKSRGNRADMVIATKVAKMDRRPGLSAKNIFAACEESLNRLQTDYIDLYYSHEDDASVSLEETLGAYAQLIAEGKVRYIAASNFTAARLRESIAFSENNNIPAYIAVQDLYNLVDRKTYETDLAPTVESLGISNIPFYGIARGFLSGKYRPGVTEVDSKRAAGAREYATDKGYAVLTAMDEISAAHNGAPLSAIALAWLRSQPSVSVPIASARTVPQLEEIVQVVELTSAEVEKLNAVSN